MPLTIANVLGFIPTNLWRQLKKFVTKDGGVVVFDVPFKLSTKYTPGLLIIMMCLSFANQFVRNIEIDCTYASLEPSGGQAGRSGYSQQSDTALNDYCWNHDTFLVAKALNPKIRGLVTYPGVSGYDREKDEVIRQRYYKQVWYILGKAAVVAFLPLFLWKMRGTEKMRGLIDIQETDENTEEEVRVTYFLETLGFNEGFAMYYLFCKILSAAAPFIIWILFTTFIGKHYRWYGWESMVYFMDSGDAWPNPMDVLFPKMAKCEWNRYGFGGDIETKSAQCQLPMNNLSMWSFFVFWWWCVVVFFINFFSAARLVALWICPPYRTLQYRSFVQRACKQDVEKARTYTVHTIGGQFITKRYKKSDIVMVSLSFGDWLVLSFLKRNLADWQFREFVKKLVVTENSALQLKPMPSMVIDDDTSSTDKGGKGGKGDYGKGEYTLNMDDIDAMGKDNPLAASTPAAPAMGFIPINGYHPPSLPTYSACGTNECDDDEVSPTSTPHNGLQSEGDDSSIGNTSVSMLVKAGQPTINITPPAKINRSQMQRQAQTHHPSSHQQSASHRMTAAYPGQGAASSKPRR